MHHYFLTLINGERPLCTVQLLKPVCDKLLSNCVFNFKVRRCAPAHYLHAAATMILMKGIPCLYYGRGVVENKHSTDVQSVPSQRV